MRSKKNARVLVTDGFCRKSLSAVRSLGKAGYHVTVLGDRFLTTAFWSRFTLTRIVAPPASENPERFGHILLSHLKKNPGTILIPMEDATLMWVAENIKKLKAVQCRFLIPDLEMIRIAQDKAKTLTAARALRIPCPETWEPESASDFTKRLRTLTHGDFIMKPRSNRGSTGFVHLSDKKSEEWESHWEKFGPLLVQERIPTHGSSFGVSLLMNEKSECIASFVQKRRHEYPTSGGSSTDRLSIHSPALVETSIELLQSLKWKGIAMVEWKVDPRDKKAKLMEINPRFWGSLELAVRSGVNFPLLYVQAVCGEEPSSAPEYLEGVRCRWLIPGDILRYLNQSKMEREPLRRFFKGLPGTAEEWDPEDLPGFLSTLICKGIQMLHPRAWKYFWRG